MRFVARPLSARETDPELLAVALSGGGAAAFVLCHSLHLPWPICLFRAISGIPCPTCGATRAAIALLHGNLSAAWTWNPLALVAYCAILAFDIYAVAVVIADARRLRIVQIRAAEGKVMRALVVALVLCNWIYLMIVNPSA